SSDVCSSDLTDGNGASPMVPLMPLELEIVPDSVPLVEITYPGRDTVLGPNMQQPLLIDARDDHGLRAATLVSWRVSAFGQRDPAVELAIPLDGVRDRVSLHGGLDATERPLLPGDAFYYPVRVTHNAPGGQVGVSETYRLRLPSMTELRRQADEGAAGLVDDAE